MRHLTLFVLVGLTISCGKKKAAVEPARPITVFTLETIEPGNEAALTGSVEPYREEDISFEVSGRVIGVVDIGDEIVGSRYDGKGKIRTPGTAIAILDDTRYKLRAAALAARVLASRKRLEAQYAEVEVAKADLDGAKARLKSEEFNVKAAEDEIRAAEASETLQRANLKRAIELRNDGAGTQQEVDTFQNRRDTAVANAQKSRSNLESRRSTYAAQEAVVRTAETTIDLKGSQAGATEAHITELEQDHAEAERDVADCILRAPFSGRVTAVHVAQGAVVKEGQAVLTLTLMDPIKVAVAVSAEVDRQILWGDPVKLRPRDPTDPEGGREDVLARVFEKAEVGDIATRSFRIGLLVRNQRKDAGGGDPKLPVIEMVLPVRHEEIDGTRRTFVPVAALSQEGGKTYLYKIAGVSGTVLKATGVVKPTRVEVKPIDEFASFIRWRFQAVEENADLAERDVLLLDAPPGSDKGVFIGRNVWLFRPGALVPVVFELLASPRGYYVPVDAVRMLEGRHFVYVVENNRVRRLEVTPGESFGDLRRISADGLKDGMEIALKGVHLLDDGEAVVIVGRETR